MADGRCKTKRGGREHSSPVAWLYGFLTNVRGIFRKVEFRAPAVSRHHARNIIHAVQVSIQHASCCFNDTAWYCTALCIYAKHLNVGPVQHLARSTAFANGACGDTQVGVLSLLASRRAMLGARPSVRSRDSGLASADVVHFPGGRPGCRLHAL